MSAQHTPGEWMLDGIQNNSGATTSIIVRSARGNASHGHAPYVAEISWPRDGLRRSESAITDEDWANARLIAAAPKLLAFAESVAVLGRLSYHATTPEQFTAIVDAARAAVRKAAYAT